MEKLSPRAERAQVGSSPAVASEKSALDCINWKTSLIAIPLIAVCVLIAPTFAAGIVFSVVAVSSLAVMLLAIGCISSSSSSTTIHHRSIGTRHVHHVGPPTISFPAFNLPVYPGVSPAARYTAQAPYGSSSGYVPGFAAAAAPVRSGWSESSSFAGPPRAQVGSESSRGLPGQPTRLW